MATTAPITRPHPDDAQRSGAARVLQFIGEDKGEHMGTTRPHQARGMRRGGMHYGTRLSHSAELLAKLSEAIEQ
jgi:hypothetical protein